MAPGCPCMHEGAKTNSNSSHLQFGHTSTKSTMNTTTFRAEKPISGRRIPNKATVAKAPSVVPAQPALTPEQLEDVLRQFDLNPRYGPFVGIDRMERWERAEKFGLDPPPAIHKLLQTGNAIPQRYRGSLW